MPPQAIEKLVHPDILTLHHLAETVAIAPKIAINVCIGVGNWVAVGHKPFVVQKINSSGNAFWSSAIQEFETLKEALSHSGATPYGSSTLCSACRQLDVEQLYSDFLH